jgi:CBS domain containing-hemolysin-like protein
VGILHIKDLISALTKGEEINIEKVMRKPFFVPESKRIDTLLREFKRRHVHIAIAIDEYGGVSGIVCLEDIIEEIVGNIQDEFDDERDDVSKVSDNVWICDARVDLDDLNEELDVHLPNEEFDTLGGFVFDLFGKIPSRGEKVTWSDFDFVINDMEGNRINSVKVIKTKKDS